MSKVVAVMSMSLDGYIADPNGGVGEVFDWYMNSGNVEFHTGGSDPMTFKVSPPSAEHLRSLFAELGALVRSRVEAPLARPSGTGTGQVPAGNGSDSRGRDPRDFAAPGDSARTLGPRSVSCADHLHRMPQDGPARGGGTWKH